MNPLCNNSSATIRNIGFIKGALELGHTVDTVTLEPDFDSINYDNSNFINLNVTRRYMIKPNILYKKFRSKKRQRNTSPKKMDTTIRNNIRSILKNLMPFDPQIINIKSIKLKNTYQLVISSSDPKSSHLLAKHIIKKNRLTCPWYQYWGDPMKADITYIHNNFIKDIYLKREESKLLKAANRVIYTSPLTLHHQKKLYPNYAEKMIYVVQSCIKQEKAAPWVKNSYIQIGYFGDYYKEIRDIMPLISAIKQSDYLKLIIAGSGDIDINYFNTTIYPRLSFEEVGNLEQNTDILVGICNKKGTQIPAKFYYMAGTQKPVILITDGEYSEYLQHYFKKYNRYIICQNISEQISTAIQTAIEQLQQGVQYSLPAQLLPINVSKKILDQKGRQNG